MDRSSTDFAHCSICTRCQCLEVVRDRRLRLGCIGGHTLFICSSSFALSLQAFISADFATALLTSLRGVVGRESAFKTPRLLTGCALATPS